MKTISSTAIAALVTATLGAVTLLPAQAQTAPADAPAATQTRQFHGDQDHGPRGGMKGDMPGQMGGMGDLLALDRGAEAIEIGLVRLAYRLDLTTEQQGLLDALKTSALAAAEEFATATEGLRPSRPAEGTPAATPDFTQRLENRIAIDKARVAALESVQPAFSAFFDSLSEDQLAKLMPEDGGRFGRDHRDGNGMRDGHGPHHRPGQPVMPGAAQAPAAPEAPAQG